MLLLATKLELASFLTLRSSTYLLPDSMVHPSMIGEFTRIPRLLLESFELKMPSEEKISIAGIPPWLETQDLSFSG